MLNFALQGTTESTTKSTNPKKKRFDYGGEYRSKKSGGDVKIKGKADPFAYVPFSKDRLNKRYLLTSF